MRILIWFVIYVDAGKEVSQDLSDDEKNEKEKQNSDLEEFRKWMKGILGDKITRVEVIAL